MPDTLSHFNEKSDIVVSTTEWGNWWQNVQEVHICVFVPPGTRGKDLQIIIKPNNISCALGDKIYFEGRLFGVIHPDESTWTIEDKKCLRIILSKADFFTKETPWISLLENQYEVTELEKKEISKKLDLERFQMENPGMDFSNAKRYGE